MIIGNVHNFELFLVKVLSSKVTIDLYVLYAFMMHRVIGNAIDTFVFCEENRDLGLRYMISVSS